MRSSYKLSVAIISFNEEDNIARCIEAVKPIADEIVVVDSLSTDRTVEIAQSLGAAVYVEPWKGYVDQKNSALEKCSGEWILFLDCDEVVSPELAASLKEALAAPAADGYRVNRLTFFLDRWIKHAWYPDWNARLLRRGAGKWEGLDLHETLVVRGEVLPLKGDLHHYSFRDLRDFFERTVRYAATGAQSYKRGGKRPSLGKLLLNPLHGFFKHYILKRGFLDGLPGFLVSVANGIYIFMKYALLWELQRDKKSTQ
ncbi:MAG TPA: glycosyltransferase family 2 protein [Geomonas sp.]|nr:glycosyltransferase family 2 protein [Geomonas sp.]